jgi:tetratricopeptide (TPR) repeat protein
MWPPMTTSHPGWSETPTRLSELGEMTARVFWPRALEFSGPYYGVALRALLLVLVSGALLGEGRAALVAPETNNLTQSCRDAGKVSPAISQVLQVLSGHPSADGYNALGALFAQGSNFSCAIPAFETALRLDPNAAETRFNLAVALVRMGKKEEGADNFRLLISQQPDSFVAHNALGLVLEDLGDQVQAAEEFKAALKINPRFALAASNLAHLLHGQKRYQAEIFYLREALASDAPKHLAFDLQLELGAAYELNGDTDQAVDTLRSVVASNPDSAKAHFNLATEFADHVRYKEAAAEYKETIRLDPGDNSARLSLAKALVEATEDAAAVPCLQEYIRRAPQDYEGYLVLGRAHRRLGDLTGATEAFRRAAELKPDSYEAQYNLGHELAETGDRPHAIAHLEAAEKLDPHAAEAPYALSLIYRKQGDLNRAEEEFRIFQQEKHLNGLETDAAVIGRKANDLLEQGDAQGAAEAYREAIRLEPDNAKTQYNLALALQKLGAREEEEQVLEKAVELDPNLAEPRNQLGTLYMADGKMDEAEKEFKAALSINPEFAESENDLGALYARQGKNEEALALLQKATEHDPKNVPAFLNWGLVLATLGHYSQAEEAFKKAIVLSPDYADAYEALGMAEERGGAFQEAIPNFQKVVSLQPDSAEAHIELGIAMAEQYDLATALEQFSEAERLNANSAAAHFSRGQAFYDLGKNEEARKELETALRLSPSYGAALYALALVEKRANNLPRSTELLQKLVALDPRYSYAQYLLGQNLLRLGKQEEAIQHWQLAVDADPNDSQTLYALAETLKNTSEPEAKVYMDRFQAFEKDHRLDHVKLMNQFALKAANNRDWPQAREQLREAVKLCGNCTQLPMLHKNLGLVYARTGDIATAERELHLALVLNPDEVEAQNTIKILAGIQEKRTTAN